MVEMKKQKKLIAATRVILPELDVLIGAGAPGIRAQLNNYLERTRAIHAILNKFFEGEEDLEKIEKELHEKRNKGVELDRTEETSMLLIVQARMLYTHAYHMLKSHTQVWLRIKEYLRYRGPVPGEGGHSVSDYIEKLRTKNPAGRYLCPHLGCDRLWLKRTENATPPRCDKHNKMLVPESLRHLEKLKRKAS